MVEEKAERSSSMSAEEQQEANKIVEDSALIHLFGTTGDNGASGISSAFTGDNANTDIDAALQGVTSGVVATASNTKMRGQTDSSGRGSAGVEMGDGPSGGNVKIKKAPATRAPVGDAKMEKADVDADGDCPKLFNKTVRKYLSQVKRCHTEAIKQTQVWVVVL